MTTPEPRDRPRTPAGVPSGGQFSASGRAESAVTLTEPSIDEAVERYAPELAADLVRLRERQAGLRERLDEIEVQARPVREEFRLVRAEIEAIHQMAEEQVGASDDLGSDSALVALSGNGRANAIDDRARALHPYIGSATRWSPDPDDDSLLDPVDGSYIYLGASVHLNHGLTSSSHRLDPEQGPALASALREFAARFCPEVKETGRHPGMVYVSVISDGDYFSPDLWHSRDGQHAEFYTGGRSFDPEFEGTLDEVCTKMIARTRARAGQDR